jgi:hypothetical protein
VVQIVYHAILVRSVLMAQAVYHTMALDVPTSPSVHLVKIDRAFIREAIEKVSYKKCKVSGIETICHPTKSFVVSLERRENVFCTLPSFWFEWTSLDKS